MRLARPRFTVRRMMVGVAVVGILLAGVLQWRRAARAMQAADFAAEMENLQYKSIPRWDKLIAVYRPALEELRRTRADRLAAEGPNAEGRDLVLELMAQTLAYDEFKLALARDHAAFWAEQRRMYEHAAYRPWLPLPRSRAFPPWDRLRPNFPGGAG